MSVESIGRALNLVDPRLTYLDRLVLIGIANHDGDGGAWPSRATLARYAGQVDARSITRSIARLVELGYVERFTNDGGGRWTPEDRRPNRYVLHLNPVDNRGVGVTDGSTRNDNGVTDGSTRGVTDGSTEPSCEPPVSNYTRVTHEGDSCPSCGSPHHADCRSELISPREAMRRGLVPLAVASLFDTGAADEQQTE